MSSSDPTPLMQPTPSTPSTDARSGVVPRLADIVTPFRHAAIVGATASGKSAVAMAIARRALTDDDGHRFEIVSADSMQVYRGMDIGTAKPTAAERAEVPHHLVDIVDPHEEYTVARFARDVRMVLADIEARGARALLVGGTGLYARAAVDDLDVPGQYLELRRELEAEPDAVALHARLVELDPVAAGRIEPGNRRRTVRALEVTIGSGRPFSSYGPGLTEYAASPVTMVGVRRPRPAIDARIEARFHAQLAAGFLDEVRALDARAAGIGPTAAQALGYRELLEHVRGVVELEDATELAIVRTRQFARRQERWFRRDPRITWWDAADTQDAAGAVDALARQVRAHLG